MCKPYVNLPDELQLKDPVVRVSRTPAHPQSAPRIAAHHTSHTAHPTSVHRTPHLGTPYANLPDELQLQDPVVRGSGFLGICVPYATAAVYDQHQIQGLAAQYAGDLDRVEVLGVAAHLLPGGKGGGTNGRVYKGYCVCMYIYIYI